jgi:hypothetical protein
MRRVCIVLIYIFIFIYFYFYFLKSINQSPSHTLIALNSMCSLKNTSHRRHLIKIGACLAFIIL